MGGSLLPESDVSVMPHIYKCKLLQYAQRKNIGYPVYTIEAEGPPHIRRFRSTVSVDGKSYGTLEFFLTRKQAEQTAAKAACDALIVEAAKDVNDEGLYKNLLQEFAQKRQLRCPTYDTTTSGLCHNPIFVSTVAVGKDTFRGIEAKTKKQAEIHAAKLAYCTLTNGCLATKSTEVLCKDESLVTPLVSNLSQNIQTTETTKKHQDTSNEGCLASDSPKVFCMYESPVTPVVDNFSQNIQVTATIKKCQDEGCPATKSTEVLCTYESPVVDNFSQNIQPTSTTKRHLDEGCLATKSSEVSFTDESPVIPLVDNLSQNIQLTATSKKHQDTSHEDPYLHAKRAKPSLENTYAITPSPCYLPSVGSNVIPSQVGNACPAPAEGAAGKEPLHRSTVKVFPRKSNLPIPEGATVMPFSDDQWVAYRVET